MGIGRKIKRAREEAGLTQKELSRLLGCAEITVRQYELDKREPKQDRINEIASILGVPTVYFSSFYKEEEINESIKHEVSRNANALIPYLLQDIYGENIIDMALYNNNKIKEDNKVYKYLFFITCQMEWSEAIINKIQPSIEKTKQVSRNLFLKVLQKLQKAHKIRQDVDVGAICEILMCMYGGMMEAYFTKRLNHDFDSVVRTGFNLIFNSIKEEDEKDED